MTPHFLDAERDPHRIEIYQGRLPPVAVHVDSARALRELTPMIEAFYRNTGGAPVIVASKAWWALNMVASDVENAMDALPAGGLHFQLPCMWGTIDLIISPTGLVGAMPISRPKL